MREFTTRAQKIGKFGENIVKDTLIGEGLLLLQENYSTKYGEIDLILRDIDGKIIFVEVKTVTKWSGGVSSPEEQFHERKQGRIIATAQEFLHSSGVSHENSWEIWLVVVFINTRSRKYRLRIWKQPF